MEAAMEVLPVRRDRKRAGDGTRTRDSLLGRQMVTGSQYSPSPMLSDILGNLSHARVNIARTRW